MENNIEIVFNDSYEKLYSCAYRLTGNHENAEDVLQNAFLKALKNIGNFRGDCKLYTWIYRIVVNESYNYFEYIKKLPVVRITENSGITEKEFFRNLEYIPDYDDNLIIEEMREKCLHGFLRCMPKKQRACFILKNCLELKNQEIADIMEISLENAKVTLHRGRKHLQELFEMRCSLIDPDKPCKCHLWIKYMREHNLEIPKGYDQIKNEELKSEHFKNLSFLKKIDYMYRVDPKYSKEEFTESLKNLVEIL